MNNRILTIAIIAIIGFISLNAAQAQHADPSPYIKDNQIHTGQSTLAGPGGVPPASFAQDTRAFGYDFELAPADFGTDDPGYLEYPNLVAEYPDLSYFPAGTRVAYIVKDDLKYWDGVGPIRFGTPSANTLFTMSLGGNPRVVGAGTGELSPRHFVNAPGDGSMHVHVSSELSVNGGGNPAAGIYLVELQLAAVDASNNILTNPLPSLSYWTVYNNQLDESIHDAAIEWVETHLVPEPATLITLAGGGIVWMRRRH